MDNVIHVYRKDEATHSRVHVGSITREPDFFKFRYSERYKSAPVFVPIFPFLDKTIEYKNKNLFPVFASRLPDPKRIDIKNILNKYHLDEYDQFNLLRESHGRLPIDTLEFVSKLSENDVNGCEFLIAGTRHYDACIKNKNNVNVSAGDILTLIRDDNNTHDQYAVKILFEDSVIGFVPAYYSKTFAEVISKGNTLTATVISVKECTCDTPSSVNCYDCINIQVAVSVN